MTSLHPGQGMFLVCCEVILSFKYQFMHGKQNWCPHASISKTISIGSSSMQIAQVNVFCTSAFAKASSSSSYCSRRASSSAQRLCISLSCLSSSSILLTYNSSASLSLLCSSSNRSCIQRATLSSSCCSQLSLCCLSCISNTSFCLLSNSICCKSYLSLNYLSNSILFYFSNSSSFWISQIYSFFCFYYFFLALFLFLILPYLGSSNKLNFSSLKSSSSKNLF